MPQEWIAFLREFGLPTAMLAIGGWLVSKGIFVTGKSAEARIADLKRGYEERIAAEKKAVDDRIAAEQAEKAYREERRLEERANRLLTEEALRNQVTVMRDMTELLKDIERNFRGSS